MLKGIRILLIIISGLLAVKCKMNSDIEMNNNAFNRNLNTRISIVNEGNNKCIEIDMSKLTPFKWDTMYYFSGETSGQQISDAIGFAWDGSGILDDNRRLVFVYKKRVVSYTEFNKIALNENDSEYLPAHFYYCFEVNSNHAEVCSVSSAKFLLYKNSNKYGIEYVFINLLCKQYHKADKNLDCLN